MPITKIPIITQFVLKQFAKKSARKSEGIATLLKASDPVVQSNVRNIEIILKNMGINPKNLTSTDDVLNAMNYHKAMVDHHLKKQFGSLDLDKGIKSLLKSGDVKKGVAPKTTKETLKAKKDKHILLRDSEEGIARIKRENKQAVEDFKKKFQKTENTYLEELDKKIMDEMDLTKADLENMSSTALDDLRRNADPTGMQKSFGETSSWRGKGDFADDSSFLKDDYEVISGTSKKGKEISEKLGITARPGFPIKESGKADLKLVKTTKKDRPSIRLIKNFDQELDDITLAKEGYNLQEIGILQRARNVMKKEGQNPDDALAWVRSEMADDAGVDFEDFMIDFDWGDFPGTRDFQSGGLAYMLGEPNTRIEALQHAGVVADPRGLYTDPSIYTKGETDEAVPQNYYEGGGVGRGPWTTGQAPGITEQPPQSETPVHHAQGLSDPMKAPRGLPSVAPKNMDPAYIQQQMMQKAMMSRGPGMMGHGSRPMAAEGGIMRMGFKKGGDMSRRGFLKLIAGLAALPVVGKYFKAAKPIAKVAETFTHVPIKDIPGMPVWFKPLVARVIKEGDDVTKQFAVKDLDVVHHAKLPGSGTDVLVTQQLDTGDVLVDIGMGKHGWSAGRYGQPARLEYKAAEDIMTGPSDEPFKSGRKRDPYLEIKTEVHEDLLGSGLKGDPKNLHLKPGKTKEEFWVDEAEFTGDAESVKFEETVGFKYGDHASDF